MWDGVGGENPSVISQITMFFFFFCCYLLSVHNVWVLEIGNGYKFRSLSLRNTQSLLSPWGR